MLVVSVINKLNFLQFIYIPTKIQGDSFPFMNKSVEK